MLRHRPSFDTRGWNQIHDTTNDASEPIGIASSRPCFRAAGRRRNPIIHMLQEQGANSFREPPSRPMGLYFYQSFIFRRRAGRWRLSSIRQLFCVDQNWTRLPSDRCPATALTPIRETTSKANGTFPSSIRLQGRSYAPKWPDRAQPSMRRLRPNRRGKSASPFVACRFLLLWRIHWMLQATLSAA